MKNKTFKAMPGLVLLPIHVYTLKTIVETYTISVPITGKFSELYPDFFELTKKNEDTDTFKLFFSAENLGYLLPVDIVELLFATCSYPKLESDEIFSIGEIVIDENDSMLHITGAILKIIV